MQGNKNGRIYQSLIASLIIAILVAGCGAAPATVDVSTQAALGIGETISGMQSVLAEGPGTFIMQNGNQFMMAWPKGSSYAFTFLSSSGAELSGINTNVFSFSELVSNLEANGWQYIGPASVPALLFNTIMSYTIEMVMIGVNAMPSIFIMPMMPDSITPWQPEEIPT